MKSQFEVFLRLKPSNNDNALQYKLQENKRLQVILPRHVKFGMTNNNRDNLDYNFTYVFDQKSQQEDIFKGVAIPVIKNFMEGYNGTIFAYGQTGSGKTYTMSGAETWQLRGVIPRVLSHVYDEMEKRSNKYDFQAYISFMEIYNENAYDLLEKRHLETPMEQWNKIALFEDEYNNINLKNLSVHQCANEQEGIDLLMMGNFIRQVSSTPMNQSSSRSHCIFTITLEGHEKGSETCFISKLHLVDLAGSERISKTQVEGNLLNEAKYINLSLTYLEQVIIALNEKMKGVTGRQHIPYRNSLMTTLLKDSLGGNCKTVMIATISSENDNVEETLSTLRFSQRVGQLENEIRKNEKVDLEAVVKRLEQEKLALIRELEQYQKSGSQPQRQQDTKDTGKKNTFQPIKKQEPVKFDPTKVLSKVESYLNERVPSLEIVSIEEAQMCFESMKDLYNTRMREYVTELTFISDKLQKYDEILTKKKQDQSSIIDPQKENSKPDLDVDVYRNESPPNRFQKRYN